MHVIGFRSLRRPGYLAIRPDIIGHEPFDRERHRARTDGNLAVIKLKLRVTAAEARADFQSLCAMLKTLNYRLGIFVNIDAVTTHVDLAPLALRGRVVCLAVGLRNGKQRSSSIESKWLSDRDRRQTTPFVPQPRKAPL